MFADDIVLRTKKREEAGIKVEDWRRELKESGPKANIENSEYATVNGMSNDSIVTREYTLKRALNV